MWTSHEPTYIYNSWLRPVIMPRWLFGARVRPSECHQAVNKPGWFQYQTMSQVVSDHAASNEDCKVFANYVDYNYRLTFRIATPRFWRTWYSAGLFRCVFHTCVWLWIIRRTLVMSGLSATLTRWCMQGGYIFTLTQLIFLDRVRVIWALQTHRKVSHYCSNIPSTHTSILVWNAEMACC